MSGKSLLGKRVFLRAISRTVGVYKRQIEGIGGQVVVTVFALGITASQQGPLAMFKEASTYLTVLEANATWVVLLFLWYLWLAPYELALEALEEAKAAAASRPLLPTLAPPAVPASVTQPAPKKYNFTPFKITDRLNGYDLARVLAAIDAGGNVGDAASQVGFEKAVRAAMETKSLILVPEQSAGTMGLYDAPISLAREVLKNSAIKWGEAKGFNMDPIK